VSRLFFGWFDPLAWKGYKDPLQNEDLWEMKPEDTSKEVMPLFMKYWKQSVAKASAE
jgi:ATP-binding cassette, subfamily C (CFTR/MRP), member 1